MRYILLLLPLITISLFSPFSVAANKNFSTQVLVTYTYDSEGICLVEKQFTVTNLTSDQMISSYELYFFGPLPPDLRGFDSRGKLNFQTEPSGQGTRVRIIFNTVAAGKNEKLSFNIFYSGTSASQIGNRWEMSLPKTDTLEQIDQSILKLIVPDSFGNLVYSSYSPDSTNTDGSSSTFTFLNFLSNNEDIHSIFSRDNIWGFRIFYDLLRYEVINLPSDTLSQKVIFKSISPQPENIFLNGTGQWQASFMPTLKYPVKIILTGQFQFASSSPEFNYFSAGVNPSSRDYFPEPFILPKTNLSLTVKIPWQILPIYPQNIVLKINNNGNAAAYKIPLAVSSHGFNYLIDTDEINVIPPGGYISIPLSSEFPLSSIFSKKYLVINAGELVMTYNIPANHLLVLYGTPTIIFTVSFISFAFLAHYAWSIYLQKSSGKSNIHRKSK